MDRGSAVAVLGFEAAVDLFGSAERALGGRIRVEGRGFEVIGVADPKGRQYMNTNRPDNRLLIVPITTAASDTPGSPFKVRATSIRVTES